MPWYSALGNHECVVVVRASAWPSRIVVAVGSRAPPLRAVGRGASPTPAARAAVVTAPAPARPPAPPAARYGYNVSAQLAFAAVDPTGRWVMDDRYYTRRVELGAGSGVYASLVVIDSSPCISE